VTKHNKVMKACYNLLFGDDKGKKVRVVIFSRVLGDELVGVVVVRTGTLILGKRVKGG